MVEAANREFKKHKKLVIISFTKESAAAIDKKLTFQASFAGTIHGFALKEIMAIQKKHIFKSKIMKESEIKEVLTQALMKIDNGIKNNYKQEITKVLAFMSSGFYNDRKELLRYFKILDEYTKIKRKFGLYDYNDTPQYLLELIDRFNWELKYEGLFVDEVQDIDQYEFELIQRFKCKTFLIGDPRQSIYIFRNSVPDIFDKFENLGYNMYILTKNYRSFQEILDYADAYLEADKGYGGVITDAKLIAANPKAQILCRTNREVEILSPHFEKVSTVHAFKGLESDDVIVVDFLTGSQESLNVKFVALTRAKNRLGITTIHELLKMKRSI